MSWTATVKSEDAEQKVVTALGARGFRCEPFAKAETRSRKTPDRRVYDGDELAFYLEIKEIEDVITHGLGDSILDRIAAGIHHAVAQFNAVNPQAAQPNVLAFVNRNRMCGALDLIEVVTGHRLLEGGETAPIGVRWSEGRICGEKWRIHLWLWFDCHQANQIFFNTADPKHLNRLASLLGIDPASIPDVVAQHAAEAAGRGHR